jgi:hypothetical protein
MPQFRFLRSPPGETANSAAFMQWETTGIGFYVDGLCRQFLFYTDTETQIIKHFHNRYE